MSETYEIDTVDGFILDVNKQTNEIDFVNKDKSRVGKYTKEYSKALLQAHHIMESSPYKSYKPIYLDPTLKTGQSSSYLEFKAWQELYLKEPVKGAIAPWTKQEKAYYESLKTKRERYKYLVIRSGLRSSVIDIPYEAYAGVDENGKLINKEYEYLYAEVEANRGLAHLSDGYLAMSEWNLAAGILGDINGFKEMHRTGFTSRSYQSIILLIQLGDVEMLHYSLGVSSFIDGVHQNPLRKALCQNLAKNPPLDSFGMLPYLDEMIGVDWVMDYNEYRWAYDGKGYIIRILDDRIEQGKLKDPRDKDSTPESRKEFLERSYSYIKGNRANYDLDIPNEWSEEAAKLYMNTMLLEAKVISVTPPQSYPNAPTYYIPEYLEEIYKEGKLDKKLNPTIPAIYRETFPQELRDKIEWYAKKHHIK
ncbi:hypothetical protein LS66_004285 [Helicobacter sp. MIT 03-1614]|uniref:hypothetical protein n=1 Tax=Helicobacter sp. MIT 03-1614 TaxID=1548147 RepID=UPI0010FE45EE|nr:hypothetical protein [Helicobacter sp. MIT 03-1614]TLD89536.1 hypothetical protein LS66_004285 [Helicobacter sp. MIT 03-1614]